MLMPTHGCAANFMSRIVSYFSKRKLTQWDLWLIALCAMIPDVPFAVTAGPAWLTYMLAHPVTEARVQEGVMLYLRRGPIPSIVAAHAGINYYLTALSWDHILHNIFFWMCLATLALLVKKSFRKKVSLSLDLFSRRLRVNWILEGTKIRRSIRLCSISAIV